MVNKERVQMLVDALRSGTFVQGKNYLETDGGRNCCLGVACRVAEAAGLELNIEPLPGGPVIFDGEASFLPPSVRDWYGFDDSSPLIDTDDAGVFTAVTANDTKGWDFEQIADGFERFYLG